MDGQRWFASDNNASVHPAVMAALAAANSGHAIGYGDDPLTAQAEAALALHFGEGAQVRFVLNGTGANVYALGCMAGQGDAVICADCAHILVDETGAPGAVTGVQLVALPTVHGKLSPAAVARVIEDYDDVHKPRPAVLSLSQPTELGTVYSQEELASLCELAHRHGLRVHIDGARLANAAAALGCGLAEAAGGSGRAADAVCVGGTKNGLMFGEAVVFGPRVVDSLPDTARLRKTRLQLASKMRYIAAQFLAYLTDDLWLHNARTANARAAALTAELASLGLSLCHPLHTNALFIRLPAATVDALRSKHFFYDWEGGSVRWMTSWDTSEADIAGFLADLRDALPSGAAALDQASGLDAFADPELRARLAANRRLLRSNWDELELHPSPQQRKLAAPERLGPLPADAPRIDLPDPLAVPALSTAGFTHATLRRKSQRRFADGPISLAELSYLLWAVAGQRREADGSVRPGTPFRTVPSAGCRHPLDCLLYLRRVDGVPPGLYRYDSAAHQLARLKAAQPLEAGQMEAGSASPLRRYDLDAAADAALLGQLWDCAALVVWSALPYRTEWRYTLAAAKLVLLDAGHACQALYGACTALGLGTCAIGAYQQAAMDRLFGLDGEEEFAVYAAPLGRLSSE